MTKMWHDAVEWAERLRPTDDLEVADVEQEVFDRAPLILLRHERLRGVWAFCLPRSVANQVLVLLSGLSPIFGGLAFMGGAAYRNIQSPGLSVEVAIQVVMVCFSIGFVCKVLEFTGWWRVGRRTKESDLMSSWILMGGSGLTLALATVHPEVRLVDVPVWPAVASFVTAVVAVGFYLFGNSQEDLPAVDISGLTDRESQVLLEQRNAALEEAAKRKAVKLRKVNKAVKRPLGALVAQRHD